MAKRSGGFAEVLLKGKGTGNAKEFNLLYREWRRSSCTTRFVIYCESGINNCIRQIDKRPQQMLFVAASGTLIISANAKKVYSSPYQDVYLETVS